MAEKRTIEGKIFHLDLEKLSKEGYTLIGGPILIYHRREISEPELLEVFRAKLDADRVEAFAYTGAIPYNRKGDLIGSSYDYIIAFGLKEQSEVNHA